jgi:hypothetical protein
MAGIMVLPQTIERHSEAHAVGAIAIARVDSRSAMQFARSQTFVALIILKTDEIAIRRIGLTLIL